MKKNLNSENKKRMAKIIPILAVQFPDAWIVLEYENPFELLVSTILSAQCTDERVNKVTESLFKKYRYPEDYLKVPVEELENDIFSTGFYKAKAKNIRAMVNMLNEKFNGQVPGTMDELTSLPGVGRKTANVVLGHCFNTPGIVVDTHVSRLANRIGFVQTQDAVKIEFALMELVPKNLWTKFTHYLISLGRNVCQAKKPMCYECRISELCPKII